MATNAADLLDYDMGQPALKFAHQTAMQPINAVKAMKQSWYNEIFSTDDENRKKTFWKENDELIEKWWWWWYDNDSWFYCYIILYNWFGV